LLVASVFAAAPLAADTTPSPARVAVIDLQRAVLETEDGLRVQSSLRKYFDRRQSELNSRQDELARKKDDIERQGKVLSREALQRAMEDWQHQMADLQTLYGDYDRELQKRRGDATAPIYQRVAGIVRKVAKRDGFDLVLERQAVPYARADLELTDRIIVMYNAGEAPDPEPAPTSAPPNPMAPRPAPGRP